MTCERVNLRLFCECMHLVAVPSIYQIKNMFIMVTNLYFLLKLIRTFSTRMDVTTCTIKLAEIVLLCHQILICSKKVTK